MATYYTLITATGQAKLAAAIATKTPVDLTYFAVGDGGGNPTTPTETQTALVREKFRAQLTNLYVDASNPNWLVAELVIPAATGGFTVREAGVFDSGGTLIAVANYPATYKPVLTEGSSGELVIRLILQVSDTSAVTILVDPSVVMASRKWVTDNFGASAIFPGGTTGQLLRKKSNTYGDCEWSDATEASETVAGIIKLATQAMVDAGTDGKAAVTPATLASRLAALLQGASQTVPGLVRFATAAEAVNLASATVALSPATIGNTLSGSLTASGWCKLPNGLILQWGTDRTARSDECMVAGAFPVAWPHGCLAFVPTLYNPNTTGNGVDSHAQVGDLTTTTWHLVINYGGTGVNGSSGFDWLALGN